MVAEQKSQRDAGGAPPEALIKEAWLELVEICEYPASGPVVIGPDVTHLAFSVDDIATFAAHSAAKGYPLSDGPTPTSTGSIIAFIDAPEGYEIEIIQRPR